VAVKLRTAGYLVNSRWLEINKQDHEVDTEYLQAMARIDLQDCLEADALVYVNTGRLSEGKATELGLALGTIKPIVIIGDRSNNIFLNLNMPCYPTIEEFVAFLEEQERLANMARLAEGVR
jgi:hypothetical protein